MLSPISNPLSPKHKKIQFLILLHIWSILIFPYECQWGLLGCQPWTGAKKYHFVHVHALHFRGHSQTTLTNFYSFLATSGPTHLTFLREFLYYSSNKIRKTQNKHLNLSKFEQSVIVNSMPIYWLFWLLFALETIGVTVTSSSDG